MHRKAKPAAERWTRELEHVVLKLPSAGNSKMLAISPNFLEPTKNNHCFHFRSWLYPVLQSHLAAQNPAPDKSFVIGTSLDTPTQGMIQETLARRPPQSVSQHGTYLRPRVSSCHSQGMQPVERL